MTDWLDWPFFESRHKALGQSLDSWCRSELGEEHPDDVDAACTALVTRLGEAGFLKLCVGSAEQPIDVRSLAIARSTLAYHAGLADFAFAMQGLGSGAISLCGNSDQQSAWLPRVAEGSAIAAFALTEPETGSDAAHISMRAEPDGNGWLLDGEKSYISNGTIADVLTVFARTGSVEEGSRGISAFLVRGDDPGLSVAERIEVIAPHPLARLSFDRVKGELIGQPGAGFAIAMQTLNLFRVTVGAAALGFARRALDETLEFVTSRRLGDGLLADHPVTWDRLAGMKLAIDRSELLIARAAWEQDRGIADNRRAAAMAKLDATEEAQKVIDAAVQLHGGLGVTRGAKVEELYREVRALRIYEGASEVQRMIIARDLLKERAS